MKKFLVAFLIICMIAPLCAGPHYGGMMLTSDSSGRGPSSVAGCLAKDGSGTNDDEVLYGVSQTTGKEFHFRCESDACEDSVVVAILGKGCVRYTNKCYENAVFECRRSMFNDDWDRQNIALGNAAPEYLTIKVCENFIGGTFGKELEKSHKVLVHKGKIYEDYVVGSNFFANTLCYAFKCNDGYKLNSDGSNCLSDKEWCSEGAVENRSCASATEADGAQCKYVCKNSEWYYDSVVSCNPGYVPADGGCKKEEKSKTESNSSSTVGKDSSATAEKPNENNKKLDAVTATTPSTTTNGNQGGELKNDGGNQGGESKTENKTVEGTSDSGETPNSSESANASSDDGAGGSGTSTGGNSTDENNNESEAKPEETKPEPEEEKTTDSGLNEEDSQAKIDELQAESDAAHEKENSTANKLLGAAGIGATGIGAMQMMSGMAEQNADEDAENQMKAYLATFRCNYGGLSHKGGEMAIELPGSGDLLPLYTEYVNLANDLKIRKAALDMRPGIEAEAILDGATSGLYDDVHTGKTAGMYTSLARALSDPNGEDAKKWQEQKDAAAKKKKTGMITAAVGAAGSLVGNLIINRDKKDKKTNDESLNKLHDDIGTLPPQTANCPSNTTGTYPDCQCKDTKSIFNPNTLKCDPCKGDKVAIDGTCQCPTGTIVRENDKCETPTNGEDTNTCTLTGDNVGYKKDSTTCECINGFVQENNQCVCKEPMQINSNGICITVSTNTTVTTKTEIITLSNDQLFAIGSYTLVDGAKNALKSFLADLSENGKTNCKIDITGYADPVGSENGNLTLSKNRANAIKDYLENNKSNNVIKTITAVGMGENYCTCGVGTLPISEDLKDKPDYKNCVNKDASYQISGNQRYAPCRRVEISADCEQTETTIESATDIDI